MSDKQAKPTSSSEKLKSQAKAAFEKGDYNVAIELFSYALEQVPRYAPYLTNRALCYYRLNEADKVLKDANASISSDPTWTKGYFYKGKAYVMLNRRQEAAECFRKCCELEPNNKEYQVVLEELVGITVKTQKKAASVEVHEAICDVCHCDPIIGIRYKCSICNDYDLCSSCIDSNPSQKGHKDSHPLIPIKRPENPASSPQFRATTSAQHVNNPQIDVSMTVQSYNVVLVIDVSLSMIGYENDGRINHSKNRWPATERGVIKIANQLGLNDRITCLAFNAAVYEVMDGETATVAKLKLASILSKLKPDVNDRNPGTALYDAIEATFKILLRNKFASLLTGNSNRNQIIFITDGEDCSSKSSDLAGACELVQQMCRDLEADILLVGIGLEPVGRQAMTRLQHFGDNRCKFLDLSSLSELDNLFDRISIVFTQRQPIIAV